MGQINPFLAELQNPVLSAVPALEMRNICANAPPTEPTGMNRHARISKMIFCYTSAFRFGPYLNICFGIPV